MNTETKQRTVPYYACEHGTPGGCNWCRTVDKSMFEKVAAERDTLRANLDAEQSEHQRCMDERAALRAEVARLRSALGACLTRIECEWPDGRDGRGASPRNPGLIRDTKAQARAALERRP